MPDAKYTEGLATPVRYLKGVGEVRAEQLKRLEIETVWDILLTLPRRYDDRRRFQNMSSLRGGETTTVQGSIVSGAFVRISRAVSYGTPRGT